MLPLILIVDDHSDITDLIQLHLRDAGSSHCGLVILDPMLPDMDGLALCQQLRARSDQTPILIILSSQSSGTDRIPGLELGADGCLTKPFSILELLARIKTILRRAPNPVQKPVQPVQEIVYTRDLVIDLARHQVTLGNRNVRLTAREFDLLLHFARSPGRVYTRMQLLEEIWGHEYEGYEHTINSHINRLRSKIEANPAQPRYIQTVRGVGYKFCETSEASEM